MIRRIALFATALVAFAWGATAGADGPHAGSAAKHATKTSTTKKLSNGETETTTTSGPQQGLSGPHSTIGCRPWGPARQVR